MSRSRLAAVIVLVGSVTASWASPVGALTTEECEALVDEGEQARDDLQTLIEAVEDDPSAGDTSDPETQSYVADLLESASINELGFVGADAGEPLDVCLPEGTTKLTMFSDPVVLWEGTATTDAYPVSVTIPSNATCGTHTLSATGPGVERSVQFEVAGSCVAAAGATAGFLPRTGAEIGRIVAIGLALVAIGYSMVRSRRARLRAAVAAR